MLLKCGGTKVGSVERLKVVAQRNAK